MPTATVKHGDHGPVRAGDGARIPQRGHRSFQAAFDEALRVSGGGASLREIRVRRNREGDSFTWTIRY